jgi:hypothetical protein
MRVKAFAVAIIVALLDLIAHADPGVPDRAKALADRGRQLQHDGHYDDAIEAYKAAYVLAPSSGLLFNLAQSYRLTGDCDDAAWMYHRYLDSQPTEEARAVATAHLARLEACSHGGFRVTVEPASVPAAPVAVTTTATTSAPQPLPPPSTTTSGHRSRVIGTWLVVGGGGALVVAALAALDAHNASNQISDAYAHQGKPTDVRALDERGQRSATIATVFGVTGGLAVVSGAILYGVGRHYEQANHVAVIPQAHGAAVSVAWAF